MGCGRAREHPLRGAPRRRRCGKPSALRKVAAALAAIALVASCSKDTEPRASESSTQAQAPTPGASGAGDPYFPDLGNGGYDVDHYDLEITVRDPRENQLRGRATITARSTQSLSRFDLDFSGLDVASVTVDGANATIERHDRELIVTPTAPIADRATFTTVVEYSGEPEPRRSPSIPIPVGWLATQDGSFVAAEPEGASTWYPVNDHPSDKATYTFHVAVPDGTTAVANGDLVSRTPNPNGTFTWTYDEKVPMASYLAQVAIGDYQVVTGAGPDNITIRNVFDSAIAADVAPSFADTGEMISFFTSQFGPFPFDIYGALVVDQHTGYALETQTLSMFGDDVASGADPNVVVSHELAHQWFGDSVTIESWKDVWLAEGFATYAEWLWSEHAGGRTVAQTANTTLDELRESNTTMPPAGDPGADDLFGQSVYLRGALTLQALRLTVGDVAFFDVLRTYASKYEGRNASTADFIAVATRVSGRDDLQPLFDAWLYEVALPRLPS